MSRFLRSRERSQNRSLDWQGAVWLVGSILGGTLLFVGIWVISQEDSLSDAYAWLVSCLGAVNLLLAIKLLMSTSSRSYIDHILTVITDFFRKDDLRRNQIIDQPELQSTKGKWLDFWLSIFLWGFFFLLFSHVFEALLWSLDLTEFSGSPYFLMTIKATAAMLGWAAVVAFIAFAIMLLWTQWNFWHYGLLNRRKFLPAVTTMELANHFGMTTHAVETAQSLKIAYVEPTERGPVFRTRSSEQEG